MNDLEQTVAEINGNFPVPGKDNISQGFRDNFTKIKAAFLLAVDELNTLSRTALRKPLSEDSVAGENNFEFNTIQNAVLSNTSSLSITSSIPHTENMIVDLSEGAEYYSFKVGNGANAIDFTNWPKSADDLQIIKKVRIELVSTGLIGGIQWQVHFGSGFDEIFADSTLDTNAILMPASAGVSIIVDVWSPNNGKSIYVSKVGEFKRIP